MTWSFEGLDWTREVASAILCLIGGALCSGSGIGGGGFYIPTFIFVLGMPTHWAIPLSKATIFGLSFASFWFNLVKRHPDEGLVYDYDKGAMASSDPAYDPALGQREALPSDAPFFDGSDLTSSDDPDPFSPSSSPSQPFHADPHDPSFQDDDDAEGLLSSTDSSSLAMQISNGSTRTAEGGDRRPLAYDPDHPNTMTVSRPLIAYDVAQLMEPVSLAGTVVGVVLNVVSPQLLTLALLVVLFSVTAYKTLDKAASLYHSETGRHCRDNAVCALFSRCRSTAATTSQAGFQALGIVSSEAPDEISARLFSREALDIDISPSPYSYDQINELRRGFEEASARILPWAKFLTLLAIWLLSLSLAALRIFGGFLACGDAVYWLFLAAQVLLLACCAYFIAHRERADHTTKQLIGFPALSGDVEWTRKNTVRPTAWSFFAGIVAAYLGVGGGLIKAPVMLGLGMIPTVAAATSTFMILFTSSSSSLQYAMIGSLSWARFLTYFVIGACGALVGQLVLSAVLKSHKKQHIIAFLLGSLVAVSGIAFVASAIYQMVVDSSAAWSFHGPCPNSTIPRVMDPFQNQTMRLY